MRARSLAVFLPLLLAAGLGVAGAAKAADMAGARADADATDEGSPRSVTQQVQYLLTESNGRVPVALHRYAQMYFLHRTDAGFVEHLRLLQEAQAGNRAVRLTFHAYSGRIVAVSSAGAQ